MGESGIWKGVEPDLAGAIKANGIFSNEPLVLARNENSDLLPVSKECSREFFELLFGRDGPLWSLYAKTGIGHPPETARHLNFIGGRMYFCKNVEKRFMRRPGPEKRFALKGGEIIEENPASLASALLIINSPFEIFAHSLDISLLPIYVNEKAREFSEFRKISIRLCEDADEAAENAPGAAKSSMGGALRAMEFSFVSSLAAAFGVRMADQSVWQECEAEKLYEYSGKDEERAIREFGFHSEAPYDISIPRLRENPSSLRLAAQPAPGNMYARWRENAKFLCSRYMCAMREAFLEVGNKAGLGELVFHLRVGELAQAMEEPAKWAKIASERKKNFDSCLTLSLPAEMVFSSGSWARLGTAGTELQGVPAGSQAEATGPAVFIDSDEDYSKDAKGKIIVSKTFSPNLTILFKGAKGMISESGGVLSHSAIIAREMGLPCVVQAKNMAAIREGQTVKIDGKNGKIGIL
ncbi:MAG: PEP-utilizing enzyme [Candidatus Micrarchaeota archaeon]|nr:PEP-utilizing enzyme [Candidatus Micrarchaeota archaeon]